MGKETFVLRDQYLNTPEFKENPWRFFQEFSKKVKIQSGYNSAFSDFWNAGMAKFFKLINFTWYKQLVFPLKTNCYSFHSFEFVKGRYKGFNGAMIKIIVPSFEELNDDSFWFLFNSIGLGYLTVYNKTSYLILPDHAKGFNRISPIHLSQLSGGVADYDSFLKEKDPYMFNVRGPLFLGQILSPKDNSAVNNGNFYMINESFKKKYIKVKKHKPIIRKMRSDFYVIHGKKWFDFLSPYFKVRILSSNKEGIDKLSKLFISTRFSGLDRMDYKSTIKFESEKELIKLAKKLCFYGKFKELNAHGNFSSETKAYSLKSNIGGYFNVVASKTTSNKICN